jgi:pyruvate dehydrogenase E2 component (dihydrolipoamide acetyltransferase)
MATSVIMPRQGQSVESCILSKWHKQPGDPVKTGDLLFSYETDKASFDEEAKADGVLIVVLAEENDDVPCLAEVCRIGTAEEFAAGGVGASEPVPEAGPAPEAGLVPEDTAFAISPRARALAVRTGVDPSLAMPSGPDGRIIERDIQKLAEAGTRMTPAAAAAMAGSVSGVARTGLGGRVTTADVARGSVVAAGMAGGVASSAPSGTVAGSGASTTAAVPTAALPDATADLPGYTDTALPNIRKVIAKAMFQSISTTCQLTLNTSFDATALRQQRALFKQAGEKMPEVAGITLTDMILFAVARTLPAHPDLNAWFMDTHIRRFAHVHLGLAVDTERGLMVPTIFGADTMSLAALSTAAKAVARECQTGAINPDKLKGGTFTVTNLGTFGIESFTPVLNTPQTGILGVNTLETKVREGKNGIETYQAMGLSLTFDHRAIDGAPAARFLQDLSTRLESFGALLAL